MSTPTTLTTISVLAQASGGFEAGVKGLLAQVAAIILGGALGWITIVLYWRLLVSVADTPTPGKLATIFAVPLFAAFLVGATPELLDAAYAYGQGFLNQ